MNVHLGWVGSATPPHMFAAYEAAKSAAPGCMVTLHEGEDMVPESWRARMNAVNMRAHMRSDVQRHCILQKYGGLWIDADVTLLCDPSVWAADWDRYTIIRMFDNAPMYGSDMIYVPPGWEGWPTVNSWIQSIMDANPKSYGIFSLAGEMTLKLHRRNATLFSALNPGKKYPFDPRKLTKEAVVARGFKVPPAPGLGDMVAAGLSAVGITKERVSKMLGRPCGCPKRQQKLNELGRKFGIG